jgi:hypothetical protein
MSMRLDAIEGPATPVQEQERRDEGGRFVKGRSGNPAGRVAGTRNHATLMAEALFDGEAAALARKAIELGLGGDPAALRLCLDRVIAPRRGRPVEVALPPVNGVADIAGAMTAIARAAARGEITPGEAGELAQVVATMLRAIESSEFERRLALLEADQARGG